LVEVVDPASRERYFFASLDELVQKLDTLWGDFYEGSDSVGRRFRLERHGPPMRWWHCILPPADRTFLVIAGLEDEETD
jgi:hypothetical protein